MRITVSDATRNLLNSRAAGGRMSEAGSRRLPDGTWEVEIDDDLGEVLAHIDPNVDTAIRQVLGGGHA